MGIEEHLDIWDVVHDQEDLDYCPMKYDLAAIVDHTSSDHSAEVRPYDLLSIGTGAAAFAVFAQAQQRHWSTVCCSARGTLSSTTRAACQTSSYAPYVSACQPV